MFYKRGSYKKIDRTCEVCKVTFKGTRGAKFCSNKCKQIDKINRKKDKGNEQS